MSNFENHFRGLNRENNLLIWMRIIRSSLVNWNQTSNFDENVKGDVEGCASNLFEEDFRIDEIKDDVIVFW